MDDVCSVGLQENAVGCCACQFPLLLLCEEHLIEHQSKQGHHFTLPLRAQLSIPTKEVFFPAREWLTRLGYNFDALRGRVEELSRNEEKIDAVYGELQQHACDIRARLKAEFALAKTHFQTAIEVAIKETSDHALDTQSFVPADTFSQLLWFYDSGSIAAQQFYTFQANCVQECLESAFQVVLQFALPGFEHLRVGQVIQAQTIPIEEHMKALVLKDETHYHETEGLRKALEDAESAIQNLQRQLQGTQEQLRDLREEAKAKESRYSALQKELERKNAELTKLVREKEDQLTDANNKIATLEQHCSAMSKQVKELKEVVPVRVAPLEKLIAVLKNQVQRFEVATSQWQEFLELRQNIQVDWGTSSTFIPPNSIFVCGGYGGVLSSCTKHVGYRTAYMLEGYGSVQELPQMSAERNCPGVTWDSRRQALYVFGGYSGNGGTYYSAYMRISEMYQSKWSPLPDMHQARYCFNPCWHSSIIYLCGGHTNSVEAYDPRSNTFALQDFTLPEEGTTTAVMENGTLIVISENYISKFQQGRLTSQKHGKYNPWSNCTPLVSGEVVYVVKLTDNCCRCIDLTSGAVLQEVSLS